jgi:hypothetical protein
VTRLVHSNGGFLRSIQMSSADLIALTEGLLDRPFFGCLLAPILRSKPHLRMTMRSAQELPDRSGGKGALISYFEFLRRSSRLVSDLDGKRTVVLFLLDKDLDDVTHSRQKSEHVIYTTYFDVESYLFHHGDLVSACAAATMLEPEVFSALRNGETWTRRRAIAWRLWVTLCVFEVRFRCSAGGNYGICPSPVHDPDTDELRADAFEQRLALLQQRCGFSVARFAKLWKLATALIDRYYARGQSTKVFKGKWYAWLLARDVRAIAAGRDADIDRLERRITQHLLQTLDFRADWAKPMAHRASATLERCFPTPARS